MHLSNCQGSALASALEKKKTKKKNHPVNEMWMSGALMSPPLVADQHPQSAGNLL